MFTLGKKLRPPKEVKKMKTELKREFFYSAKALCNFVNEHRITKKNIQTIMEQPGLYVLFYWEVTVWKK